jgi:hypothetical protein
LTSTWRALFTDSEDQADIGYVAWLAGVMVFLALAVLNYEKFDAQTFGIGFGAILGSGGAMTWMRARGGVAQ